MPIEIRELIIRTSITEGRDTESGRQSKNGYSASLDQEQIVEQCVQEVLEILKSYQER